MNFTREPLIETIISAKDGYKLILRNSKTSDREEFLVDVVEVISFGGNSFFRSLDKSRRFMVPVSDYELLEEREARIVLKMQGPEKGIKIAGGRDAALRPAREPVVVEESTEEELPESKEAVAEPKGERRREKKRFRKRRGRTDTEGGEDEGSETAPLVNEEADVPLERLTLIPPPSTLISETLGRYKIPTPPPMPEQVEIPEQTLSYRIDSEDVGDTDEEVPF